MSTSLIDNWLDAELDEKGTRQLEEWLRDEPDRIESFFDAVWLQEELCVYHGGRPVTVVLPSRKRSGIRLIVSLAAAAALLVAAYLIIPRESDPQPTANPLVWVLAGNPRVEVARVEPGPNPVPVPREEWTVETRVTIADELSTLRWGEDCELDADPRTVLTLRSPTNRTAPKEARSIRLDAGRLTVRLTVRLTAPTVPVDIIAKDYRVRAAQPAEFTLSVAEFDSVLSVTRGNIELLHLDANRRSVATGERVSLP